VRLIDELIRDNGGSLPLSGNGDGALDRQAGIRRALNMAYFLTVVIRVREPRVLDVSWIEIGVDLSDLVEPISLVVPHTELAYIRQRFT
jgi:hypothetical protein